MPYVTNLGYFISEKEARRYATLLEMEKSGAISALQKHISIQLLPAAYINRRERKILKTKTKYVTKKICIHHAITLQVSFTYKNKKGNRQVEVVRSPKQYKDPAYIIKKHLLYRYHRIKIIEN